MATTKQTIVIADGWVQVVASTANAFLVENATSVPAYFAYGTTVPTADDGHLLRGREKISQGMAGENLYVKAKDFDVVIQVSSV